MRVMRLIAISIAFSHGAYAGTSDPSGGAVLVLWAILIAGIVWLAVSFFLGLKVTNSMRGGLLFLVGLGGAPVIFLGSSPSNSEHSAEIFRSAQAEIMRNANLYLVERCSKERIHLALKPVIGSSGVAFYAQPDVSLKLKDVPVLSSPTPLMQEGANLYGSSYPIDVLKVQYQSPVYWSRHIRADSISSASRFLFAEEIQRSPGGLEEIAAAGRKDWWLNQGLSRVSPEKWEALERYLKNVNASRDSAIRYKVTDTIAKYVLEVRDVSTAEDRQNWVARGELILREKVTGDVHARYVGFVANQYPGVYGHKAPPWEQSRPCPGGELTYYRNGRWDALGYFFHEVVQYE